MKEKEFTLNDSGDRRKFASGAVRDRGKGKGRYDLITPFALKRIATIYEKGAEKYDDRNWEKGMPFSVFLDSTLRHIMQYIMGMEDEDHVAQAAWNLFAIMHLEHTLPGWDDRPNFTPVSEEKEDCKTIEPGCCTEDSGDMWAGSGDMLPVTLSSGRLDTITEKMTPDEIPDEDPPMEFIPPEEMAEKVKKLKNQWRDKELHDEKIGK